jgi:hypothetical protein
VTQADPDHGFELGSIRTTASHTIGVPHLSDLLAAVTADAPHEAYRAAVVDENVLGRPTAAGRQRSFRHLRELYLLDPSQAAFAALRHLWAVDPASGPLLAGVMAFTRDCILRASWPAVAKAAVGEVVKSADLASAVAAELGGTMSASTLGKTGRNTGASWTQTGHLVGRAKKYRQSVDAPSAAVAYAAFLGYLAGERGRNVLSVPWASLLDLPQVARVDAMRRAHSDGLMTVLVAGDVIDVTFPALMAGGNR